jgi:hypothetical protein
VKKCFGSGKMGNNVSGKMGNNVPGKMGKNVSAIIYAEFKK